MMKKFISAFLLSCLASPSASYAASLKVTNAWIRALPPGAKATAGYLVIENEKKQPDKLISASTTIGDSLEFHETVKENGMASMEERSQIVIPPGKVVRFKPGSLHIMIMGIKEPLKEGLEVPILLNFEKAGTIKVMASIKK